MFGVIFVHVRLIVFLLQFPALREFVQMGKPVWGTCAGLIFLANKATGECLTPHIALQFRAIFAAALLLLFVIIL